MARAQTRAHLIEVLTMDASLLAFPAAALLHSAAPLSTIFDPPIAPLLPGWPGLHWIGTLLDAIHAAPALPLLGPGLL